MSRSDYQTQSNRTLMRAHPDLWRELRGRGATVTRNGERHPKRKVLRITKHFLKLSRPEGHR